MPKKSPHFQLGRLANIGMVCRQLARVLKAMASGEIDATLGSRLCNGLGILRAAMESGMVAQEIALLQQKLDTLTEYVGQGRSTIHGYSPQPSADRQTPYSH
jgi:hypothetical protein